jgi:flagellar biosynthetic protein FlhB
MAEDDDREQRTEAPSDRRLQQAFEQGDIPISREVVTAGTLVAGFTTLLALASTMQARLSHAMAETISGAATASFGALPGLLLPLTVPFALATLAAAGAALAATFAQTRGHLWTEKAEPDLSRVFDAARLTRFATREFGLDLLLSLLKVAGVSWVAWMALRGQVWSLAGLLHTAGGAQLATLFAPLAATALRVAALIAAFAALDLVLVRLRYTKRMRMTKEEMRRETKEDEGDPMLRGARKRRHRDLTRRSAIADTRRADALIVNPTHVAIAVRYRKDESRAPRVVAKGKGVLAEAMRDAARSSGIPIIQNVPLARLLFRKVKVGGMVPEETYKAVAAVLAVVYRMTGRTSVASPEVTR